MSLIPNTLPADDRGLLTAREREGFYQFKANGSFYRLRSFLFGGAGDTDQGKFNEHRFDGRNRPDAFVMVGLDSLWSGTFSPYYSELPVIHRNLYGAPVSSDLIDADYQIDSGGSRRREVFQLVSTGANTRQLWRAQFGEILYGRAKIRSYSADVTRNADGGAFSGNATMHCNDILNYAATLPGSVAQNAIFTVIGASVSGSLVVGYKLAGSNTTRSVTMAIGDSAPTTKGKFEAFGDGVTVNITGTIAASAGERHTIVGSGNTLTFYSDITPDLATATTSSLQTAIRAKSGRATALVTGTITRPVTDGYVVSNDTGDVASRGTYAENGTLNGFPRYDNGNNRSIQHQGSNWVILDVSGNKLMYSVASNSSTPPGTGWTGDTGNGGTAPNPTITQQVGAPAALNLTIQYNVSDGNVGDIESVPGSGYVGTTTPQGGAGGTVTVEFAAPANSHVTLIKISGNAGYTVTESQAGQDGTGPLYLPTSPPVESDNVLIYMADSWDALGAIDPDDDDATEIQVGVLGHTFSSGDNANAVWTENRSVAPSNWVSTGEEVSFGLTVWKGAKSEALRALQDGCTTGRKYFRIAYKCGSWQWWQDGVYSRNEVQGKGADNELPTRTTPFMLVDDALSSYRVTIIGPAADYFIP